jgi:hypothetical protein
LTSLRWYLSYHTGSQIVLGFALGALFAAGWCAIFEILPNWYPDSLLGCARRWVVEDVFGGWPVLSLLEVEDRWDSKRNADGWVGRRGMVASPRKVD